MPKAAKAVRAPAKAQATLTSHVVERLRKAGADDSAAGELADAVAGLAAPDWAIERVLTRGQYGPDGVWVHMTGQPEQLAELIDRLQKTRRLEELRVFIKGLLPDIQVVEAQVGLGM